MRFANERVEQAVGGEPKPAPPARWTAPAKQFVLNPDTGRWERTYACEMCEDRGVVTIPEGWHEPRPWPTARDLYDLGMCLRRPAWAQVACPECRAEDAKSRLRGRHPGEDRLPYSEDQREWILLWQTGYHEEKARREAEIATVGREAWRAALFARCRQVLEVVKPMPAMTYEASDRAFRAELAALRARRNVEREE